MRGGLAPLLTILVAACGGGGGDGDGAWLPGYQHRKRIDLHPPSSTELEDFSVAIITETDPELAAGAQADGSDLVVADASGEVPRFELESFDKSAGRLALWVRLERLAGPTSLWLYYGGDTYPADPAGTWPTKFAAVWHMVGVGGITSPDSTVNGLDVEQPVSTRFPSEVKGLVGDAMRFDGIDDMLLIAEISGSELEPGTGSFSYCLWANPSNNLDGFDTALYAGGGSNVDTGYDYELGTLDWRPNIADGITIAGAAGVNEGAFVLGRWTQLCAVVDRTAGRLYGYGDGAPRETADLTGLGSLDHPGPLTIGSAAGVHPFIGDLDEIRVYTVALSPAWIEAEYENLIDPAAFLTLGHEETAP
jgi:hypothetical protein